MKVSNKKKSNAKIKKLQPCPVCGKEPVVKKQYLISTNCDMYFAECKDAPDDVSHEIITKPGKTTERALFWWNAVIKKLAKQREKVIAERETTE